jgi:hypothetical protein
MSLRGMHASSQSHYGLVHSSQLAFLVSIMNAR